MIFQDKNILITGGTGSMGSMFIHRVLGGKEGTPRKVIVLSRDEAKQHNLRVNYLSRIMGEDEAVYNNFKKTLEFRIGDVRSYQDICSALQGVDIVVNAAALKQVPTCEYFPHQAILTNCLGAANIIQAIQEHQFPVETVVGISTDKASKPVNVMGMTKAIQERIFTSANILNRKTRFICVRYGNVMASRGSVIPLFHKQIACGGPVTITLPEMSRFLLTLNDAVETVFNAIKYAEPGETFVPTAPSATVENIAKALVGNKDIEIKASGIRPGEKIHEILISEEEIHHTVKKGHYYAIRSMLPELSNESLKSSPLKKEMSSADYILSLEETIKLLNKHNLLEINLDTGKEFLL